MWTAKKGGLLIVFRLTSIFLKIFFEAQNFPFLDKRFRFYRKK